MPLSPQDVNLFQSRLYSRQKARSLRLPPDEAVIGGNPYRVEQVTAAVKEGRPQTDSVARVFLDVWTDVALDMKLHPAGNGPFMTGSVATTKAAAIAELKYRQKFSERALKELGERAGAQTVTLLGLKKNKLPSLLLELGVVGLARYASGAIDDRINAELDTHSPFHADSVLVVIGKTPVRLHAEVGGADLGPTLSRVASGDIAGAVGSLATAAVGMDSDRPDAYLGIAFEF